MVENPPDLRALEIGYRPLIIEGSRRFNHRKTPKKAGWPWVTERWRIWQVDEGVLIWHHGTDTHKCTPGMWMIQQADRVASHVVASPGARWGQLRFALFPGQPVGDPMAMETFGRDISAVIPASQTERLRPALSDIFEWWWRDPWHRIRADARLSSLLANVLLLCQEGEQAPSGLDDVFRPADMVLTKRPLASLADLAAACGMSERTFRRRFREVRGITPAAYAKTRMVAQACDLLRMQPGRSVEDIAIHLGYAHVSAFIRAFTSELGLPPGQWRRQPMTESL